MSILVVNHAETLQAAEKAVQDPRFDHCECWLQLEHQPTATDCSSLQHSTTRLAAQTAHVAALQHAAELVHASIGWMTPTDARQLVEAVQSLALSAVQPGMQHE